MAGDDEFNDAQDDGKEKKDATNLAALSKLRHARGQCKRTMTMIENFIQGATAPRAADLQVRLRAVDNAYSSFATLQTEIAAIQGFMDDDEGFEERYFNLSATISNMLEEEKNAKAEDTKATRSSTCGTKLPHIDIPEFSGGIGQYRPFIDLFSAVIGNNRDLSDVQRLFYLRKYLKGEALALVDNLPLINDSYTHALELLNKRYDNKALIVNNHINNLLDLPAIKGSAQQLRSLVSQVRQQVTALQNLGQAKQWDTILVCILTKKLDTLTSRLYHSERSLDSMPTLEEFLNFLEKRAIALEASPSTSEKASKSFHVNVTKCTETSSSNKKNNNCSLCYQNHKLFKCSKFQSLTVADRLKHIGDKQLCTICLNGHLQSKKCRYSFFCSICKSKSHNTLLHETHIGDQALMPGSTVSMHNIKSKDSDYEVLLPTVKVRIRDQNNRSVIVRAMLDSGSQTSFCTQSLVDKLGTATYNNSKKIVTMWNNSNKVQKGVDLCLESLTEDFKINVSCSVVDQITTLLPQNKINLNTLSIPSNIVLSDKDFHVPGEVSLLLAANVFFKVIKDGKIEGGPLDPVLINTRLGYVVSGDFNPVSFVHTAITMHSMSTPKSMSIDELVKKFWETEQVPQLYNESLQEHEVSEEAFNNTVKLSNNRFEVSLPLKIDINTISPTGSFSLALQRFYNLEKRFKKDPFYFQLYKAFIQEYLKLGHAKVIDLQSADIHTSPKYFLPHHAVVRNDKKTNKLRVVFDGSAKPKGAEYSLNNILCNGGVVQRSLFEILILFRTFNVVLMCDVRHMYRQILVAPEHRVLQNILWRESAHEALQCLQLQTITYGLTSSAFIATRCLMELARIHGVQFPLAANALKNNTYVDDVITGASSTAEAVRLKQELIDLLKLGSFELHKWCSNEHSVIGDIPEEKRHFEDVDLNKDSLTTKTLGITYEVQADKFKITAPPDDTVLKSPTKRKILSYISKFFDPLGLISPIFVKAKNFLQKLWQNSLDWDTPLPAHLNDMWLDFHNVLINMPNMYVQRNVRTSDADYVQLIGFCDASLYAYGCCLYIKAIHGDGCQINLLCAKSRIAPLEKPLTIPRLELNSALLLAKLARVVMKTLPIINDCYLYTDSKIVLDWLRTASVKLPAYVGNRVKEISNNVDIESWRHTPGSLNPADILSRGANPEQLSDLWWHGPEFLTASSTDVQCCNIELPLSICANSDNETHVNCHSVNDTALPMLNNISSFQKMVRVMAYVMRFIAKCKKLSTEKGVLSAVEIKTATLRIIQVIQREHFHEEINCLKKGSDIKSNLKSLHPFIDQNNILRVGGRLEQTQLTYSKKFPIILPKKCHVTTLIIRNEHLCMLHAGLKLTMSSLIQKYWIVNAVREIKKVIHRCVKCFRVKTRDSKQLMGTLPSDRVTPARPFETVGVDFFGPVEIKQSTIRRSVISKGYVAVFVCFATKAVHMEVTSDLTTDGFIAAFKRFVSRRGLPTDVHCDNASTFKGADNQLTNLFDKDYLSTYGASKGIQFHFAPAYSPNFGGLWEAAVKSAKHHFKRVIGPDSLTYEQLNTIIVEIEGILNSRPITPISQDPLDFSFLTPAHFLIGCTVNSVPEPDVTSIPTNRLRLWRRCMQVRQHFWQVWHKVYLSLLNERTKWHKEYPNLKENMLVLLKDDNCPPLQWPMARIEKVFAGPDQKVRVVQVRTSRGSHRRAISKIVVLPIEDKQS